jgi:hypothetical protein
LNFLKKIKWCIENIPRMFLKKTMKKHKFKGVGVAPIKVVGLGHWILIVCFLKNLISWELKVIMVALWTPFFEVYKPWC